MSVGANPEEALQGIALGDGAVIEEVLKLHADNFADSKLDKKSYGIARIAALIATGAPEGSFVTNIKVAKEWGVTDDDLVGILIALAPMVGTVKIVAAAPAIAVALNAIES
jgi:4-carboxymuconolactone decarboxylase